MKKTKRNRASHVYVSRPGVRRGVSAVVAAEINDSEDRMRGEFMQTVRDWTDRERRERRETAARRVFRSLLCGLIAAWATVTLYLLVSGVEATDWPRAQLGALMFAIGLYVARRL